MTLDLNELLKAKPGGCQETMALTGLLYVACNRPAVSIVATPAGREQYRMCEMCADHSLRNRGFTLVGPFKADAA